jgi:Icc-related predicted phosphoesterase
VREFIEEQQPELCLCGHIHESRAEDRIGKTHVINPGPLKEGGYVLLRLAGEGGKPRVLAELKILG